MPRDVNYLSNPDPARPTSRYNHIRVYVDQNRQMVQETLDPPGFPAQPGDTTRTVQAGEDHRPDLIAKSAYGDMTMYWVLARANGWDAPFEDCRSGEVVRIPDPDYVNHVLATR